MQEQFTYPDLPKMEEGVQIKLIPGFHGYAITSNGDLYSCLRRGGRGHKTGEIGSEWRAIKVCIGRYGYYIVTLGGSGRKKTKNIHSLVMLAYVGVRPEGKEVAHWNGIKTDNRLENLRYATYEENLEDKKRHGMTRCQTLGEKHVFARLKESEAKYIMECYIPRHPEYGATALARRFGVARQTVSNIVTGIRWPHIQRKGTEK